MTTERMIDFAVDRTSLLIAAPIVLVVAFLWSRAWEAPRMFWRLFKAEFMQEWRAC